MRELHVFKAERLRQVIPIERRAYVVGRSMSADIVIPDHRVSRKHCTIYYDTYTHAFHVADLNSKLGTHVNGRKIEKSSQLRDDDVVSFGTRSEFILTFVKTDTDSSNFPRPNEQQLDKEAEEEEKRITSSINLRQVVQESQARLLNRRLDAGGKSGAAPAAPAKLPPLIPGKNRLSGEEVAARFYELSSRLALTSHHQEIFEILSDHIFQTMPAERFLLIRGDKRSATATGGGAANPRDSRGTGGYAQHYFVEFCEFASNSAPNVKAAGTKFSRSMVRKAVAEQKGLLFTSMQDPSESQLLVSASSSICAPLLGRGEPLGCLYLDHFDAAREGFGSIHLELAGMYAYIVGLHLERHKALEEKRESERLASAGLAVFGAAHYLKNVLTGLQGSRQVIDLLLKGKNYDQLDSTWGVLTRSLDAVGSTIKKMLEYARTSRLDFELASPVDLMAEATEPFLHAMEERGIRFETQQAGTPFPILCDGASMLDVLQNLISNAIDAFKYDARTAKPQPMIAVRAMFHDQPPVAVFEVEDNGPGIPEEHRGRLFDLFFSTKGAGGSGLGLALCQKHVAAHGGKLTFATSNEGTVFRVELPQSEAPLPGIEGSSADTFES